MNDDKRNPVFIGIMAWLIGICVAMVGAKALGLETVFNVLVVVEMLSMVGIIVLMAFAVAE